MNEAFSEYVLYEPILRILSSCGFAAKSEVVCPGFETKVSGDHKRLDFVANGKAHFAVEVKWIRRRTSKVASDVDKLERFLKANTKAAAFLCVFGRKSVIERWSHPTGTRECGAPVYAEFGVTRFGCRVFEVGG
jgi:hypothetical protein